MNARSFAVAAVVAVLWCIPARADVDPRCMNDCTMSGYQYGYCQRRCYMPPAFTPPPRLPPVTYPQSPVPQPTVPPYNTGRGLPQPPPPYTDDNDR